MIKFSDCPLFSGLNPAELKKFENALRVVNFPWQSLIFQEGDVGGAMYFINEGRVKIGKAGQDGQEVVLAELGEGSYFGEMSLLDDQPRSAYAITMTDSILSQLTKRDFLALLRQNPDICIKLLQNFSRRLRETNDIISTLSFKSTEKKLVEFLSLHRETEFSPERLAARFNSSPETISLLVHKLQEEGLISVQQYKLVWVGKKFQLDSF